ncbi:MAG: hypothetical protein WAM11_09280, partial [Cyanobium sp.]
MLPLQLTRKATCGAFATGSARPVSPPWLTGRAILVAWLGVASVLGFQFRCRGFPLRGQPHQQLES